MRIFTLLYKCQICKWDSTLLVIWITQGKCAIKTKLSPCPSNQYLYVKMTSSRWMGRNEEDSMYLLLASLLRLLWDHLSLSQIFPIFPLLLCWSIYFSKALYLKNENKNRGKHFSWSCALSCSPPLFKLFSRRSGLCSPSTLLNCLSTLSNFSLIFHLSGLRFVTNISHVAESNGHLASQVLPHCHFLNPPNWIPIVILYIYTRLSEHLKKKHYYIPGS